MRRDLLLGMILAAVLHFSAALYSHITRDPVRPPGVVVKDEPVARLVLPLETPVDQPEITDDPPPPDVPPPISPDPVQAVAVGDIVIPPAPPAPPVFGKTGAFVIPVAINTSSLDRTYRVAEVDRAPQAVLQVAPAYPAAMKAQHMEGRVVVQFVVDANSIVRDVRVVSSSDRAFEYPALQAVQRWKFKAGLKANQPVSVLMEVPINFHLAK